MALFYIPHVRLRLRARLRAAGLQPSASHATGLKPSPHATALFQLSQHTRSSLLPECMIASIPDCALSSRARHGVQLPPCPRTHTSAPGLALRVPRELLERLVVAYWPRGELLESFAGDLDVSNRCECHCMTSSLQMCSHFTLTLLTSQLGSAETSRLRRNKTAANACANFSRLPSSSYDIHIVGSSTIVGSFADCSLRSMRSPRRIQNSWLVLLLPVRI